MTTYVYETVPAHEGQEPQYYEIRQSMKDAPLSRHPDTGERIRRVVTGGYGLLSTGKAAAPAPQSGGGGCCGGSCHCH